MAEAQDGTVVTTKIREYFAAQKGGKAILDELQLRDTLGALREGLQRLPPRTAPGRQSVSARLTRTTPTGRHRHVRARAPGGG